MGFILLGIASGTLIGYIGSFLYILIYSLILCSFFIIIINLKHFIYNRNIVYLHEFQHLRRYYPVISYLLSITLLGMASFPPIISFFTKVLVLFSLIEIGYDIMVLLLLLINLISVTYYMRFIQEFFFYNVLISNQHPYFPYYAKIQNWLLWALLVIMLCLIVSILFSKQIYITVFMIVFYCKYPFIYF